MSPRNLADEIYEFPGKPLPPKLQRYQLRERGIQGFTALQVAASICCDYTLSERLLKAGADPNDAEQKSETLAHSMTFIIAWDLPTVPKQQYLRIMDLLCRHRLNLNCPNRDGVYPLHIAADAKRTDIMAWLLCRGANASLHDRRGRTPESILPQRRRIGKARGISDIADPRMLLFVWCPFPVAAPLATD